jgi:hypothetical protein
VKKLSVVTSLIGYHPLLLDTLKSVLNQRGVAAEDLEYVVWYGGSPNPLINDVIETFSDRVRFLGDNDDGLYDSLAQVLPLLSGEVICYLNVGDLWSPTTAADVINFFSTRKDCQWICGIQSFYDETGHMKGLLVPHKFRTPFIQMGLYGKRFGFPFIQQESTFWRKELHEAIDWNRLRRFKLAGDAYLWHTFSYVTNLKVVPLLLGGIRSHSNHLSADHEAYSIERQSMNSPFRLKYLPLYLYDQVIWRLPNRVRLWLLKRQLVSSFTR